MGKRRDVGRHFTKLFAVESGGKRAMSAPFSLFERGRRASLLARLITVCWMKRAFSFNSMLQQCLIDLP
jgi:hypothetical protein